MDGTPNQAGRVGKTLAIGRSLVAFREWLRTILDNSEQPGGSRLQIRRITFSAWQFADPCGSYHLWLADSYVATQTIGYRRG
jgi:hypothetical protein